MCTRRGCRRERQHGTRGACATPASVAELAEGVQGEIEIRDGMCGGDANSQTGTAWRNCREQDGRNQNIEIAQTA
jgi:hypothetical protein